MIDCCVVIVVLTVIGAFTGLQYDGWDVPPQMSATQSLARACVIALWRRALVLKAAVGVVLMMSQPRMVVLSLDSKRALSKYQLWCWLWLFIAYLVQTHSWSPVDNETDQ